MTEILTNIPSKFLTNFETEASELLQNLEEMFLVTTWTVMLLTYFNLQPHNGGLPCMIT